MGINKSLHGHDYWRSAVEPGVTVYNCQLKLGDFVLVGTFDVWWDPTNQVIDKPGTTYQFNAAFELSFRIPVLIA